MLQPLERARQLYGAARDEKRAEAHHRRRARERMAELRAFCAANGIAIETFKTETERGQGHAGQRQAQ